jgi:uncharacterized surface protein with fasciclin (FAS1) repeats
MDMIQDSKYHQTDASSIDQSDKSLDSLVKYLKVYPDLTTLLSGTDKYTLFAPSNSAFKNLIALPGFPPNIKQINPDLIKAVLSYHIVSGTTMKSDIKSGATFSTLYTGTANNPDDKINVNADGTLLTGSQNTAIQIITPDQQATNGVVHVTGTVLIPQTVGASLTPILGTLAGNVFLGADFTYLAKLVNNADQGVAAADQIRTLLATPAATETSSTTTRTFFALPNAFFTAAAAQNQITVDQLIASLGTGAASNARAILRNHIITSNSKVIYTLNDIANSNTDVQFTNGMQLPATNIGVTLTVSKGTPQPDPTKANYNPYGVAIISPSNPASIAPIAAPDIVTFNGSVMHAVLGFLKPQ